MRSTRDTTFAPYTHQEDAGRHDTLYLGDGIHTFRSEYNTIAHKICERGSEDSVACGRTTSRLAVAQDTSDQCLV